MPRKGWRKPDARTERIKVRVSEAEEVTIRAAAAMAGMSCSEFLRDRAINADIAQRKPDARASHIDLDELRAAGDELNDLAKAANSGKHVDLIVLHDVLKRLRDAVAEK